MIRLVHNFLESGARPSEVKEYNFDGELYIVSFFKGKDAAQIKKNFTMLEKTKSLLEVLGQ